MKRPLKLGCHFPKVRVVKSHAVVVAAAALALVTAPGTAQTVVAGRVIDPAKQIIREPLKIELLDRDGSVVDTSATLTDGTFALAAPRAGTYRVRFIQHDIPTHVSDSIAVADGASRLSLEAARFAGSSNSRYVHDRG